MSFKGDLSTIGLGEVFQMISMSQKEGTLIVQDSESRKCVFFGATGVQLLSSGKRKGMKVGDMLLRAGKVTEAELEDALENGRIQRKMVGEVLVESGVVSQEEIQRIIREQIEEEIYDLFLWKKANFEFVEGPAADELKDPDAQVTKLSFDVNGLLLEAVRRSDEWVIINQTVPSIDSIFTFVSESDRHEEDKTAQDVSKRVYRLVDGRVPISEIVENTGVSKFEACKVLVDLFNRGRIRLLTVPETMDLAMKRMAEGSRERGMRMYLAAAAQAPDDAKVLSQVAKFLEGEGLGKEASGYHVKAGHIFLEQGDLDRAMDHMQRASAANPDDPAIQMGMFEVHAAAGNLEEGKKIAKVLVAQALMAPDLPRARALCDRLLNADPGDMEFRIYRAKALHRANLKKELAEDLDYIKKNMPANPVEAERIEKDLREVLVKRPSSVHPTPKTPKTEAPKAKVKKSVKGPLVGALMLLLIAGGAAGYYETTAKRELDGTIEIARDQLRKFLFLDARKPIDAFLAKSYSPTQKERAKGFLRELEAAQQTWQKDKKDREEEETRLANEKMRTLAAQIEEDRQNRPTIALQRARELREFAESHKSPEYVKKAEELTQILEQFVGGAFRLKAEADALEKDGKLRDAALKIDQLLSEYPNTDPARGALYPIEIVTRPTGVRITSIRSGFVLGETGDAPVRYHMKPTEAVRLLFEKTGYAPVERDVKDKSVGRIQVELQDKREMWVLPLGMSVTTEPSIQGDTVYLTGGSRVFAIKTNPKKVAWYETLDGTIEGGAKAGPDRVYVGTSSQALYAIDPRLQSGRNVWKYETGDRVSGAPGISADGATVYIGTYDKSLHAVSATDGQGRWKREIPSETRIEPVAAEGLVVVACVDGTILGLKGPRPEDEIWKFRMDATPGAMTVTDGVLYLSGSDPAVYAIDVRRGTRLWRQKMTTAVTGRVVRIGGTVCASGREGRVSFMDAASGEVLWTFDATGPIQGGVVAAGSLLLFGSDDQSLYAFDLTLRSLAWRMKIKGKIRVAPVVGRGAAYFGNDEGVYAVELN